MGLPYEHPKARCKEGKPRSDGSGKPISPCPARRRPGGHPHLVMKRCPEHPGPLQRIKEIKHTKHQSTPTRTRSWCGEARPPAAAPDRGPPAASAPLGARRVSRETEPFWTAAPQWQQGGGRQARRCWWWRGRTGALPLMLQVQR